MNSNQSSTNNHEGVSCDGCSSTAFSGNRYKCLRCNDYDLCHRCFTVNQFGTQPRTAEVPPHDETHPMQMIMTPADFERVYDGDETKCYDVCKIGSFTCPYCNSSGFNVKTFGTHVSMVHSEPPPYNVICPICIGTPDMEHSANRDTENLKTHWNDFHNINEAYRTEPARGVTRRPMLARRTQRQVGNRTALGAPFTGWQVDGELEGLDELVRQARNNPVAVPPEIRQLQQALGMGRAFAVPAQRHLLAGDLQRIQNFEPTAEAVASFAAAIVPPTGGVQDERNVSLIRALPGTPIFPTFTEDGLQDSDDSDEETEEGRDEIPELEAEGGEERVESNSDQLPAENDEEQEFVSDSEFEIDLGSDEDNEGLLDEKLLKLKRETNPDDFALILKTLKIKNPDKRPKKENEENQEQPENSANDSLTERESIFSNEEEQSWVPLVFEGPDIKNHACGTYWSDKRFLRQRKLQRDQSSSIDTTQGDLARGELALAICRTVCGKVPENAKGFDSNDKAIRMALKDFDFAADRTEDQVEQGKTNQSTNSPIEPTSGVQGSSQFGTSNTFLSSVTDQPIIPNDEISITSETFSTTDAGETSAVSTTPSESGDETEIFDEDQSSSLDA